ncbi:hypothetical protein [Massilia sp. YIM B04103]|uniref:hypothetical protein n=1 Tax=Massilia sp. YIM B04103 TaxID=2963106 RepID=UPI00210BDFAE|nr:hypothetical protein [Massilia sp. YIM B04103]
MKNNTKRTLLAAGLLGVVLLQGCATSIKASATRNPQPVEPFNKFSRIELKHVVFKEGFEGDAMALNKIDENIQKDLSEKLKQWNSGPVTGRSLVIEPVIDDVTHKGVVARVLLGPLIGSSGVLLRMNIRDEQGKLIASPQFFQRASAMAAGFTLGVHDNLMLTRVGNMASAYVIANYDAAVGGPTGADAQSIAE